MAVCVFVCLSANSDVSDYLHLSSGVWVYVCVCSVMFDTALEQWWMAVWVCVYEIWLRHLHLVSLVSFGNGLEWNKAEGKEKG